MRALSNKSFDTDTQRAGALTRSVDHSTAGASPLRAVKPQ
jgi:hypothetical protein